MIAAEDQLRKKLEKIRTDIQYYQQMSAEAYINERVIFKIKLYYLLSTRNKRWYNLVAILSVFSGLMVPLFLNLDIKFSKEYATVFTLLTGGLISLETIVFNFKEKFKSYKKTEDQLTSELLLYQTNSDPYNTADPKHIFSLFVSRTESIILKEREDTIEKITRLSLEQVKMQVK